jgi:CheY-like chemotaxis protein
MKSFGGDIICESELGKGTNFILKFPKIDEKIVITKELKKPEFIELEVVFKDKKILLVDDQDLNRKLTGKYLERYGAIINHAVNGLDALEQAQKNNYDLILMDIEMPIMDGLESVIEIRKYQNYSNQNLIPIIATTGDASFDRRQKIAEAGFDDCFIKGSDLELLLNLILQNLKPRSL